MSDPEDLKKLTIGDLFTLIQGVLGSLEHKSECDLTLMKGVCSCGLSKVHKDTADLIKNLSEDKNGEKS